MGNHAGQNIKFNLGFFAIVAYSPKTTKKAALISSANMPKPNMPKQKNQAKKSSKKIKNKEI
jgi:hypothetical protein